VSLRYVGLMLLLVGGLGSAVWAGWMWTSARVEVEPDTFLVLTHRWGKPLPSGEIIAPDASYQGIQRAVLPEGRYFLNPFYFTSEVHEVVRVPAKFCAVLIRKAGVDISPERKIRGEFLARGELDLEARRDMGERGILEQILGPGKYRINPYEYEVEIVPAVEIESQQVGVKILRWGKDPAGAANFRYVVEDGERGVQKSIVPSGTHYINPYLVQIVPVDLRAHTVMFEDIEFPSRDGFKIEPRVQIRYKVVPDKAAELFVTLCEDGELYQKDDTAEDQRRNPILQKIILPLIRGYVRIEGSKHDAREYISKPKEEEAAPGAKETNPRERLGEELMAKVRPECEKVGIIIDYIAVGQTQMNPLLEELAKEIREREQARLDRKTNEQKVLQLQQEQELESTKALAEQRRKVIEAETGLEQAKIKAERQLNNEKTRLMAELESAQSRLEGAKKKAEATLTKGKADAKIVTAKNDAQLAELKIAIEGFASPNQFSQYHVLKTLAPSLAEIFASDTSEFAKLFSGYLQPGDGRAVGTLPREAKALPMPREEANPVTAPTGR
jgi:hypothetical protein